MGAVSLSEVSIWDANSTQVMKHDNKHRNMSFPLSISYLVNNDVMCSLNVNAINKDNFALHITPTSNLN